MKFIISNNALKKALAKIKEVVPKNSTLPALENLHLVVSTNAVTITATDLEITLTIEVPCEYKEKKDIVKLIPFAWIKSVCDLHNDLPLEISFENDKVVVTGPNDVFEQGGLEPVANFPEVPTIPNKNMVRMNNDFISWLNAALLTCDLKDELTPWKSKVGMEIMGNAITIASTQGNSLFSHSFPAEIVKETEVMVSHKIIKALDGFKETLIYWDDKFLAFESDYMKVIATRPEGKFVNYRAVIPAFESNLTINRADMITALKKASLINDSVCHIHLKDEVAGLKIYATNDDFNRKMNIEMNVVKKYTGEVDKVAVCPSKLANLLQQVSFEQVELAIHEAKKAILLRSETDPSYLGLIMPVIVDQQ